MLPPLVLVGLRVAVGAGVEEPLPPVEEEPQGAELLGVAVAEGELDVAELLLLLLLLSVGVAEALVSDELLEVSTGGTEMGCPAAEHCDTTALDTAG